MNLTQTRKEIDALLLQAATIEKQCEEEQDRFNQSESHLAHVLEAQQIAQEVAQQVQEQAHSRIAGVVSRCLETVFEDDYGFEILFERKRGRTEANLVLTKDGHIVDDPLNADSGGVCEVAAMALRLACITLNKPNLRRLLVLDEPFGAVSVEYQENIRLLLDGLAEDFGFQIIMVTHIDKLRTGKVIEL